MQPSLTPQLTFEELDPADIPSAVEACAGKLYKTVAWLAPLGLGHEAFLRWALEDITAATQSPAGDTQLRFCANALMNARRSLACLVDEYLIRDGFMACKDPPSNTREKTSILVRRGIMDHLAAAALERAIDRRHRVEHGYTTPTLEDTQDTIHVVRASVATIVANSNPYVAPYRFGTYLGGQGGGPDGIKCWFHGWSGVIFVHATFAPIPWLGEVIPSSSTDAVVRRVPLGRMTREQLLSYLTAIEQRQSGGHSGSDVNMWEAELRHLGMWDLSARQ